MKFKLTLTGPPGSKKSTFLRWLTEELRKAKIKYKTTGEHELTVERDITQAYPGGR